VHGTHLPGRPEEGGLRHLLDAGMAIGDDQLDAGESSFLEVFEDPCPELFILTVGEPGSQDLPETVVPNSRCYQESFGDVPGSVSDLVVVSTAAQKCTDLGGIKVYT